MGGWARITVQMWISYWEKRAKRCVSEAASLSKLYNFFFCFYLFVLQDKGTDVGDDMGLTNTQKTECSHGEAEPRLVIPRCGVHVCVCVCVCCVCVCIWGEDWWILGRVRKDLDSSQNLVSSNATRFNTGIWNWFVVTVHQHMTNDFAQSCWVWGWYYGS